jgi:hypothetical protein
VVQDAQQFRQWVDSMYEAFPELFPETFTRVSHGSYPKSAFVAFVCLILAKFIGSFRASSCRT